MERADDIPVVFENGVFKPEVPVHLPNRTRASVRLVDTGTNEKPSQPENGPTSGASFASLRAKGLIRTGGRRPLPSRDELHERD